MMQCSPHNKPLAGVYIDTLTQQPVPCGIQQEKRLPYSLSVRPPKKTPKQAAIPPEFDSLTFNKAIFRDSCSIKTES